MKNLIATCLLALTAIATSACSSDSNSSNNNNGGSGGAGGTGTAGVGGAAAGAPATSGSVTVSASAPQPVANTFFGQNFWSWPNSWNDPVAKTETQAKALGLNLLRAGGTANDTQSPEAFTDAKIDEFVAFARSVGAEPLLQIPLLKTPAGVAATAADAAAVVTYANVTKAYGIRYFSIGNEPDLYTSQSQKDATYDAKALAADFVEFAKAMRAVDPTIKIMGPDFSWKYQSGANDWLTPFLTAAGDQVDIVAVHRYPLDPSVCTPARAYADADAFRSAIDHLRAIMDATGQSAKPLAITEANITWDGSPEKSTLAASPGTFPAALWLADSIGVALEKGLFSIDYWSLSEGWTLGFIDGTTPRPAYYVLQLFAQHFGSTVLKVTGTPSGASVFAGRDETAKTSSVFVVNKNPGVLKLSVTLDGLPRSDALSLEAPGQSLVLATLADDGSAPALTVFSGGMSAPQPAN